MNYDPLAILLLLSLVALAFAVIFLASGSLIWGIGQAPTKPGKKLPPAPVDRARVAQ